MAELRPSFPPLEDPITEAGLPLHKVDEGEAVAAKNVHGVLPAKDEADQFAFLKVNAANELLVNIEGDDLADLFDEGEHAGDAAAYQDIAEIALQTLKVYKNIVVVGSCSRWTHFKVEWVDDEGEVGEATTKLIGWKVGPGQFTKEIAFKGKFTSGAAGIQKMYLRAKNLQVASTMEGTAAVQEVQ